MVIKNASNALLYGCLIEGYAYMKGSQDLQAEYEKRYFQAISRLQKSWRSRQYY